MHICNFCLYFHLAVHYVNSNRAQFITIADSIRQGGSN